MKILGFEKYAENLDIYLKKIRDVIKANEKVGGEPMDKEVNNDKDDDESDEDKEDK